MVAVPRSRSKGTLALKLALDISDCERCKAARATPLCCASCGDISVPDPRWDHFLVLGLRPTFDIDERELQRLHLNLSRDLHPDRVALDPAKKPRAVLAAAQVNDAVATLRDAFRRAEYLLKLAGGKSAEQDKSVPEGFLETMFELRSEIEECLSEPHAEPAKKLQQQLQAGWEQSLERLKSLLQSEPFEQRNAADVGGGAWGTERGFLLSRFLARSTPGTTRSDRAAHLSVAAIHFETLMRKLSGDDF